MKTSKLIRVIWNLPEFDSVDLLLLMEVNSLDLVHASLKVLLGVQHLVGGDVRNLKFHMYICEEKC